jgi:hypothetical protein
VVSETAVYYARGIVLGRQHGAFWLCKIDGTRSAINRSACFHMFSILCSIEETSLKLLIKPCISLLSSLRRDVAW